MGLFSKWESKRPAKKPEDSVIERTLSRGNISALSQLGLDPSDKETAEVLTYYLLDLADHLGDDDEDVNIVDKVEDDSSDGSDSESTSDGDDGNSDQPGKTKHDKKKRLKNKSPKHKLGMPPRYNCLAPLVPRYDIFPRPEEGHEKLPGYRSVIFRQSLLERKSEMDTPYQESTNRKWRNVHVELNNTQLSIYSVSSRMGSSKKDGISDKNYKIKTLLNTYSLQYAEVGIATDYTKRSNSFRLRAEGEQFLLATVTDSDCVDWVRNIQMGIEIALPLEERKLPKLRSIPRRRHSRRRREQLEEERMSRDLMLRPQNSRMSAVSLSNTTSRPSISTRSQSQHRNSSSAMDAPRFRSRRSSSVRFRTPTHPRQQLSTYPTNQSSMLSPYTTRGSSMFDSDFSDDEDSSTQNGGLPVVISGPSTRSATPANTDTFPSDGTSTSRGSAPRDTQTTGDSGGADTGSTGVSPLTSLTDDQESRDEPVQNFQSEDHETEDDDEADEDHALRIVPTQATTTSMTFQFGYKWNPAKLIPSQAVLIKYARRCLPVLTEDTPWVNKPIVKNGTKYSVQDGDLKQISATVPNVR